MSIRIVHGSAALAALLLAACTTASPPAGSSAPRPAEAAPLTVVSYNIRHGRGMDDQVDIARAAGVLRALAPDIVGLQEVDERVTRSNGVAQADTLGYMLGMHPVFSSFMDYQGGRYGLAILSRHPVAGVQHIRLPDGNERRFALLVEIAMPSGDTVAAINLHFDWVANDTARFKQASVLAQVLDTLSRPYILIGDFNDRPGTRTIGLFTARAREAAKPEAARNTFPADQPDREIDFIFAAPARSWSVGEVRVIDERLVSDHRPVLARLQFTRGR